MSLANIILYKYDYSTDLSYWTICQVRQPFLWYPGIKMTFVNIIVPHYNYVHSISSLLKFL